MIISNNKITYIPNCSIMLETMPRGFNSVSSGRIIVSSSTEGSSYNIKKKSINLPQLQQLNFLKKWDSFHLKYYIYV